MCILFYYRKERILYDSCKEKNSVFNAINVLLIFVEPFLGYAANNSISAGSSKTADIDTAGNLKFSVKAVGASSGTRWKQ